MDKRETDPGVYPSQEDEESHISIGTHASSSHFVVEFEGSEYIYIHISFHGVLVICYIIGFYYLWLHVHTWHNAQSSNH